MTDAAIRTNSLHAWLLAARPKTLTGAAAPVIMALAAAWADISNHVGGTAQGFQWMPAALCMAFALLMQIDANLINDYFDFQRGRDDAATRLGPERACTQGWITPHVMARGIAIVTIVAALTGLPLVLWGGQEMLIVGAMCLVFCFLYTTTLAQHGLGDLLVLLFFGLVPVCTTYYIQLHTLTPYVIALAVGMGLATDCLLVVNNYRDREQDATVGKRTLVTIIGEQASEWLYLALGIVAVAVPLALAIYKHYPLSIIHYPLFIPLFYLIPHTVVWNQLVHIHKGRALNAVLGRTAACIITYSLLHSIAILIVN